MHIFSILVLIFLLLFSFLFHFIVRIGKILSYLVGIIYLLLLFFIIIRYIQLLFV